jgi:hypothetical protein
VPSSNDDLQNYGIVGHLALLHLNLQVGQGAQQIMVEGADLVATGVVRIPGLIVITRTGPERPHDAVKVMLVFQPDVFLDELETSQYAAPG